MSLSYGPNLGLLESAATGEAHDAAMRALLRGIDGLVMPCVKGYLTNTPPGSPVNGDCYIIGAAPTGAWAGKGGQVARYSSVATAWEFFTPKNGWMIQASSARETYRYTASTWEVYYQEGTWTPSANNFGGSVGSVGGLYTKVGRMVTIRFFGTVATGPLVSTAGTSNISGLPFAPINVVATLYADSIPGNLGNGLIKTDSAMWPPSFSTTASYIYCTGVYTA